MLYLDFISSPDVIEYLQIGEEGITHNKLEDGTIEITAATVMISRTLDLTSTIRLHVTVCI